uniref:Uncharacterized protein n=1 Tax=Ditylenchus dipsaci TaxID=166011 RepID=A0A915ERF9_9BILA
MKALPTLRRTKLLSKRFGKRAHSKISREKLLLGRRRLQKEGSRKGAREKEAVKNADSKMPFLCKICNDTVSMETADIIEHVIRRHKEMYDMCVQGTSDVNDTVDILARNKIVQAEGQGKNSNK